MGAISVRRTLFTRQQLTLNRSFTSAYAQLSSDSDMIRYFKGGVDGNETELSKYVCDLKRKSIAFRITWEVIKRAQAIADGNNPVCRLCLKESTAVIYALKKKVT